MEKFWELYFTQTGIGWALVGAAMAVMFGGVGSARGIRIAGAQAGGALSEKPELFGKLLVLMALPGTQGFYSFIIAILIANNTGLTKAQPIALTPVQGIGLMFVGICAGIVEWRSAIYQGEASAAAINLTARRPEESGRAILIPALVETYAVVALLAAILFIGWITGMKLA
ncbi:MAG: V-type ATP synthase subunit K [Planctomycetes bacterium]|nr:V-type ATP synthase subunit K [Planctomycetota bacterium]